MHSNTIKELLGRGLVEGDIFNLRDLYEKVIPENSSNIEYDRKIVRGALDNLKNRGLVTKVTPEVKDGEWKILVDTKDW